jgi:predicted ATPase
MQRNHQEGISVRYQFLQALEQTHAAHQGEIVRTMGDGSLSIFSNAVDAVSCAISLQQQLHDKVPLRIGIHIGDIVRDPHDGIIGDAVNIASRIESFSVAGAVLLSDSVFDHVRNQEGLSFKPLGNFHLKNTLRTYDIYAAEASDVVVPDAQELKGKGDRTSLNAAPLPLPDMPLMGRDQEIETLSSLFKEGTRLVTISGAGGMGKTRLSIAVAHELRNVFTDGTAYVGLTSVTQANEVVPAINNALEIFETDAVNPLDGLATVIGQGKVLLVLDNMEQVVDAAPDIGRLLEKCLQLQVLITSRIPLRINAKYEFKIGPLELPKKEIAGSFEDLKLCPSVSLFTSRAKKVRSTFTLTDDNADDVVAICNRVDGMPLALELAAARIRLLTPKDLLQRLNHSLDVLTRGSRDLPERHQTLRATIDWSYSLLEPSEKVLLQKLGVFTGGFTLDCVEKVCGIGGEDVLDDLESLEEKGLVQKVEEADLRFRLLQTIREFALE